MQLCKSPVLFLTESSSAFRAKWTNIATAGHKRTTFDAGLSPIDRYAQRVFADQMALFRPAVAAADPTGVFRNAWLTEVFGLS